MEKRNESAYQLRMQKRVTEGVRHWKGKLTPEQLQERKTKIARKAKKYRITMPNGQVAEVKSLTDSCRKHDIPPHQAHRVMDGTRSDASGFTFARVL